MISSIQCMWQTGIIPYVGNLSNPNRQLGQKVRALKHGDDMDYGVVCAIVAVWYYTRNESGQMGMEMGMEEGMRRTACRSLAFLIVARIIGWI